MAELRVYEDDAGPICGGCVEEKYAGKLDLSAVVTMLAFDEWRGGYCARCELTMPADGASEGRTRESTLSDLKPLRIFRIRVLRKVDYEGEVVVRARSKQAARKVFNEIPDTAFTWGKATADDVEISDIIEEE